MQRRNRGAMFELLLSGLCNVAMVLRTDERELRYTIIL